MIHVTLPDDKVRPLGFFLAMEEWVAHCLDGGDDYFFSWVVGPTVIIGRNQDLRSEVDVDYCREHGIDIVRRRSGGGAVYADADNMMMSYITADTDVEKVFARYTAMVAAQLCELGLDARPTGRNDIGVGPEQRKISGNAYYLLADRSIVHGTMLYDTDLTNMLNAITPSRAKLESHKVKSVDARIITARQLLPDMGRDEFMSRLTAGLETGRRVLTPAEVEHIEAMAENYYDRRWLEEGVPARNHNA